jgi:DNA-binding FadR family transcriptional regulator
MVLERNKLADAEAEDWSLSSYSRKPVPELIEEKLQALIENGVFAPGDRLPTEPELAARLVVARSSLRSALQRLQIQGLIEVVRGRGWYVRATEDLHHRSIKPQLNRQFDQIDLLEVRIALESVAASLAASRAGSGELDEIAKLGKAHEAVSLADHEAPSRTYENFHAAIVRASHNELLKQLYESLIPQMREQHRGDHASPEIHIRSVNDHNQVVWFLRRHDEGGARAAMTTHLLGLYNSLATQANIPSDQRAGLTTFAGVQDEPRWHPHE